MDRAKSKTEIEDGMAQGNFDRAAAILAELGYSGPVAVASDQTVCVQTLRHHRGFIVGAQGGDIPFNSPDQLQELLQNIKSKNNLCSKIRAYTLQVPLPNIPTLVVALLASKSDKGADDIAVLHNTVIQMSRASGIDVLSIGADGAANELAAQAKLNQMSTRFLTYSNENLEVNIKVPLFGNPPCPIVTLQDPKHARKTDLSQVLQTPNSPLLAKDVFDCDKQDDGRALRTFCYQTVATTLARPDCSGLTIYLFIIGELCDAWLNKTMNHRERIRSAWTAAFFLRMWKAHLLQRQSDTDGLMSFHLNGSSHASFKIFSTLAESLIALIISHREYYPDFPFCPWKHGTEACEHIFGWMRIISPNFSVLDARLMMPKIIAVVKSIMSGRIKIPPSEHVHAGYQIDLHEDNADNLDHLRDFPSNKEISEDLSIAKKRAMSLAEFCGMVVIKLNNSDNEVEEILGSTVHNAQEHSPDVLTSAAKDYEINYSYEHEQNALSVMLDQVPETFEGEVVQNSAMSISNLLNSSDEPQNPNGLVSGLGKEATFCLIDNDRLHVKNIIELRKQHNSQVAKNKGNDRMLTNGDNLRLELNSTVNPESRINTP
ncbi:uncharacterized protein MELLADRAFT_88084 [Melampsora larici-populina 98AG31]|uniref:Uncharacterized protein n=1 Tax=Melampsora larici-populina (strain 98AG31 / pathotype 3-4-7) TaxID=747676 RepID=F4RQD8_MELLP|nr:uncharacterized protein MELLADRAFT_88084 [Melampsora larici-populina 98AG31]EGG05389.1 hypothetical protein MELLADRAFT_88084 [Melampsora larici-populina 98AG31]